MSTIPNLSNVTPMKGICYSPAPSDDQQSPPQKYFDTDFTNASFPLLWGQENGGRGDIHNLASIGVNFVHLYNWSVPPAPGAPAGDYQRTHTSFLEECGKNNIKVFIPVSNYFLGQIHQGNGNVVKGQIQAMVSEAYNGTTTPLPGAGMWGIANEFDLNKTSFSVDDVATAMQFLVEAETALGIPKGNTLPVTAPISFAADPGLPPSIKALQDLQTAINNNQTLKNIDFWDTRFVASVNPFNEGSFLKNYIANSFPQYFPTTKFFFAEMGFPINATAPTEQDQANFVANQLSNTVPCGNFIGRCVFQFLDQTAMKTGTEATFGTTKYDTSVPPSTGTIEPSSYVPGGGQSYNVDTLTQKPLYQAVDNAY